MYGALTWLSACPIERRAPQVAEALSIALPDGLQELLTALQTYQARRPTCVQPLYLIRPQQPSDFLGEWHHALSAAAASGWRIESMLQPWKGLTARYEMGVTAEQAAAALLPFGVPTGQLNALTPRIRELRAASRATTWHAHPVPVPVMPIFPTAHHATPLAAVEGEASTAETAVDVTRLRALHARFPQFSPAARLHIIDATVDILNLYVLYAAAMCCSGCRCRLGCFCGGGDGGCVWSVFDSGIVDRSHA